MTRGCGRDRRDPGRAAAPVRRGRRDVWLDAWAVIRGNRQGVIGMFVLAIFFAVAVVGPFLVGPIDEVAANRPLLPPSPEHLFGTDRSGRDLFVTNVWAARISLLVGLVASVLSMVIGAGIGISAGYLGGRWDAWLMRFTDFFYVLPTLVLALVLAAIMGPNLTNVIIVIAITSWPATARVIRSQTLTIRERMFVDRARAYGCQQPAHHAPPGAAQRLWPGARQHDPDHRIRDLPRRRRCRSWASGRGTPGPGAASWRSPSRRAR